MTLSRAFPLLLALAAVLPSPAAAQFGGMPGTPGGPAMEMPFGAAPAVPPPACQRLLTLRDEMQKHGQALQAAGQKKAAPNELCKLFKAYLAAGRKMVKGLEEGAATCGVPRRRCPTDQGPASQGIARWPSRSARWRRGPMPRSRSSSMRPRLIAPRKP